MTPQRQSDCRESSERHPGASGLAVLNRREETQHGSRKREEEGIFPELEPFEIKLAAARPRIGFQNIQWPAAPLPKQDLGKGLPKPASTQSSQLQALGLGETFQQVIAQGNSSKASPSPSSQQTYCRWRPSKRD